MAASYTAGSNADVVLTTSAGATSTGLVLARSEDGRPLYQASRTPTISPEPLRIRQTSWHQGFGQYYYRAEDPYRYGFSSGVDARIPNGAQIIPNISEPLSFGLRNSSAQLGTPDYWTAGSDVTLTAISGAARTGAYGFQAAIGDSGGQTLMEQTVANSEVFRYQKVRLACYVKRTEGSSVGATLDFVTLASTTKGPLASTEQASDNANSGTRAWSDMDKVESDDISWDERARVYIVTDETSQYLRAYHFNFGDGTALSGTVTGVEVIIKRSRQDTGGTPTIAEVKLYDDGFVGTAKSSTATWSTEPETVTFGSPTDTWGATLTAAKLNADTFGVGISVGRTGGFGLDGNAYIYFIGIKVYMGGTEAIQGTSPTAIVSSTYSLLLSDEITVANNVTGIMARLKTASSTTDHIFQADDFYVIPAGDRTPMLSAMYGDECYLSTGQLVSYYEPATQTFLPSLAGRVDDTLDESFKAVVVHGGYIYASHGSEYFSSNDTTAPLTTWTNVPPTTGDADFMVSSMDHLGVPRLYRVDLPNEMYTSNETYGAAIGAGDWVSTPYTVGEKNRQITRLYKAFDTILVGREEGLFFFYSPDNAFRSATEQFELLPSLENFDRGVQYVNGWFYTASARYGLLAIGLTGGDFAFEEAAPALAAPTYDDYGGRVRAIAHDGYWLYVIQDRPVSNATAAKTVNLMAASPDGLWHTITSVDMGVPEAMFVCGDKLMMAGRLYNADLEGDLGSEAAYLPAVFSMSLPTKHRSMMKEANPDVEDVGTKTLVTSIFDFADEGYGYEDKGFLKLLVEADGTVSSNSTIKAEFQIDGAISDSSSATWSNVGTNSAAATITSITNGEATLSFPTGTSGKRCRLRFTLATNVTTTGPILRAFTIFAMPHPDRRWLWTLTATLGTARPSLTGSLSTTPAGGVLDNLNTLDSQDSPLKFYDVDGTSYDAEIIAFDKVVLAPVGPETRIHSDHIQYGVRLTLAEVQAS